MSDDLLPRLLRLSALLESGDLAEARALLQDWVASLTASPAVPSLPASLSLPAEPASPLAAPEGSPTLSILMATYNRADLVAFAVQSVLDQTWPHFELVVVDDGSTDGTPDVVEALGDPRVRVFRKTRNEGRSVTRNAAIALARGEWVLWMADDDWMYPDTVEAYLAALAQHPETDVLYGNLRIFDGEQDVGVFEPNDWTDRPEALLGAKLFGSCVPDLGTMLRRRLYAEVGGFDPEFVRAQDYEFWTRLAGRARFRKVHRFVCRYRKHAGGVSFGAFVDLSYDSKIIRRLLTRHPLSAFFPNLDWTDPDSAWPVAVLRIAKNLLLYQDPTGAARLLDALPSAWQQLPEVAETRFEAALRAGRFEALPGLVQALTEACGRPHAKAKALAEALVTAQTLRDALLKLEAEGRYAEADAQGVALNQRFELVFDAILARARMLAALGRKDEALSHACQAVRLAPDRDDAFALAVALRAELGAKGPKVDVEAMRGRLLPPLFVPPAVAPAPTTCPAGLTVLAKAPVPGAVVAETWRAALAMAPGEFIAFLEPGARHYPEHLPRLYAALGDGAWAVGRAVVVSLSGDEVISAELQIPPATDAASLTAVEQVPLSALLVRREALEAAFAALPAALPEALIGWALVSALARREAPRRCLCPTLEAPLAPFSVERLSVHLAHLPGDVRTEPTLRDRLNERLGALGLALPRSGQSDVVVVADASLAGLMETLDAVRAHTRLGHTLTLVLDGPTEPPALPPDLRLLRNRRPLGWPKAINQGLARTTGDFVAVLKAGVTLEPDWLERLQWQATRAPQAGFVLPQGARLGEGAVLLTRGLLERVGGLDTGFGEAAAMVDWAWRARRLGLEQTAHPTLTLAGLKPLALTPEPRFVRRWGVEPDAEGPTLAPPDAALFVPVGAEPGFRPDAPPLQILEARARNVLSRPPWTEAAVGALLSTLAATSWPSNLAFWLRVSPEVPAPLAQLKAWLKAAGIAESALPEVLLVAAPLAPDREGALYATADALWVEDAWPDADLERRRAADCGRPLLDGLMALKDWAQNGG